MGEVWNKVRRFFRLKGRATPSEALRPPEGRHREEQAPKHFTDAVFVETSLSASPQPLPGQLVLVGSGSKVKWVRFRCPCGCDEVLALDMMASHSPHWTLRRDAHAQISISPSVHSTTCGAHFVVRDSRVRWA